jgi:transcriptional regulator with XRE-family HTH domain
MHTPPNVSKSVAAHGTRADHLSIESPESAVTLRSAPHLPDQESSNSDTSIPPQLSDRVREARIHAKITKAELARRVGVCLSAAVQWEHSKGTSPTVANLARIANICEVAFEWLATGRGPMASALGGADSVPPAAIRVDAFDERLLRCVREIPPHQRELLIEFARSLAKRA